MNNTLAPLKTSATANDASSHNELGRAPKLDAIPRGKRDEPSKIEDRPQSPVADQHRDRQFNDHSQPTDFDQHEKQNIDERPQSPTPEQQRHHQTDDHPAERQHDNTDDQHVERHHEVDNDDQRHYHEADEHHVQRHDYGADDHNQDKHHEVQAEHQQDHHEEERQDQKQDHQQTNDENTERKDLLKGKPIIFVGGGPGTNRNYLKNEIRELVFLLQVVVKEHNVRK